MSSALTNEALREYEQIWRRKNPNGKISRSELGQQAAGTMRAVESVFTPREQDSGNPPGLVQ